MKSTAWSGVLMMCTLVLPTSRMAFSQQSDSIFASHLMPQPASLSVGAGKLVLTPKFSIAITGFTDARLTAAIHNAVLQLRTKTGLELIQPMAATTADVALSINVKAAGQAIQSVDEDESYTLTITPQHAQLSAATVVGVIRGLATLQQLIQSADGSYVLPVVTIQDSPRFPWRGLMIDCGRHFEPIPVILRTLDGMAAVKLNVFHWHLTEDQGFRIESKTFPRLTALGSDGLFYTQDQVREVIAYARERGIRVVPEFEMPGHSTAWLVAYPELASARAPKEIRREFGVSDYALDPTREETYKFIDRFLTEMVALFPDPYLHIGGDETAAPEWKTDPRILSFMKSHDLKDPDALQAYFNQRILKILTRLHRHMIGWDEILNPALPKDIIIQSWRGQESLGKGAQQGYQGILSAGYYLDGQQPAGKHYLVDPVPAGTTLTAAQQKLILGGEVAMWAEQIDAHTIDSRVWPRTAAIAERFWSPQTVVDVDDMYRRLDPVSVQLESLGLHHLSQEDSSLRELAGTEQIEGLRNFASVLEPVSFGERYDQQKTNQHTILDQFVDAVRPDPPSRHRIDLLTRTFLKAPRESSSTEAEVELAGWFKRMDNSTHAMQLLMIVSPRLADLQLRNQQLIQLSKTGLSALDYLHTGTKPPAGWKQNSLAQIENAKKPSAIVRFTFLDSLKSLVDAVQE